MIASALGLGLLGCSGPATAVAPVALTAPQSTNDAPIHRGDPRCESRPHCSLTSVGSAPKDPLLKTLGCGPTYRYFNSGHGAAPGGDLGTFCPDVPSTRQAVHGHFVGYLAGYCETPVAAPDLTSPAPCLSVPAGKIFVFTNAVDPSTVIIGPNCPSTCPPFGNPL